MNPDVAAVLVLLTVAVLAVLTVAGVSRFVAMHYTGGSWRSAFRRGCVVLGPLLLFLALLTFLSRSDALDRIWILPVGSIELAPGATCEASFAVDQRDRYWLVLHDSGVRRSMGREVEIGSIRWEVRTKGTLVAQGDERSKDAPGRSSTPCDHQGESFRPLGAFDAEPGVLYGLVLRVEEVDPERTAKTWTVEVRARFMAYKSAHVNDSLAQFVITLCVGCGLALVVAWFATRPWRTAAPPVPRSGIREDSGIR